MSGRPEDRRPEDRRELLEGEPQPGLWAEGTHTLRTLAPSVRREFSAALDDLQQNRTPTAPTQTLQTAIQLDEHGEVPQMSALTRQAAGLMRTASADAATMRDLRHIRDFAQHEAEQPDRGLMRTASAGLSVYQAVREASRSHAARHLDDSAMRGEHAHLLKKARDEYRQTQKQTEEYGRLRAGSETYNHRPHSSGDPIFDQSQHIAGTLGRILAPLAPGAFGDELSAPREFLQERAKTQSLWEKEVAKLIIDATTQGIARPDATLHKGKREALEESVAKSLHSRPYVTSLYDAEATHQLVCTAAEHLRGVREQEGKGGHLPLFQPKEEGRHISMNIKKDAIKDNPNIHGAVCTAVRTTVEASMTREAPAHVDPMGAAAAPPPERLTHAEAVRASQQGGVGFPSGRV